MIRKHIKFEQNQIDAVHDWVDIGLGAEYDIVEEIERLNQSTYALYMEEKRLKGLDE
jgi:hypothetical protein